MSCLVMAGGHLSISQYPLFGLQSVSGLCLPTGLAREEYVASVALIRNSGEHVVVAMADHTGEIRVYTN